MHSMITRRRSVLGGMLALGLPSARAATLVRYPQSEPNGNIYNGERAEHFPVRLLQLALRYPGNGYELRSTPHMMRQNRTLLELQHGRAVDVMWTMASRQREHDLLPIRIPLDMGLIGWRLLLIRERDLGRFAAIRSMGQLAAMEALQGHDWPDTDILRANNFKVQTSSDYASMFQMLLSGRVDYFPRAVFEIWSEADTMAASGLVVAPGLALHYPSAFYFFVNKSNTALAKAIRSGLERMQADGSYDRLFQQYFGDMLRRSDLAARRVFELRNPLLSEATPQRARLWYRPQPPRR